MSILVRNAQVRGKERDIYIEDDRITGIGSISRAADEILDACGMAALPGFINTHTHAAMTLFRGWGDDMELMDWLTDRIWPMEAHLTPELVYWASKLACLEMIRTGTTTFVDMYFYPESTAKAVHEMGIRGFVGPVFLDKITGKNLEDNIRDARRTLRELNGYSDLIYPILAPHAVYTCSKELLEWTGRYSRKHDIPVHFHLLETEREKNDFVETNGRTPMDFLNEIGFLQPNLVAAHCVWADEDDVRSLARHGVNVSFNPVSNMKLAVGKVMNAARFSSMGINVCLGTDGPASNNSLSILDTMKFAGLSTKNYYSNPTLGDSETLVNYATLNGAKALSLDCGVIEEGKLADIILVDLKHESMVPARHSLSSKLAYSASPEAIRHVICNGRLVMKDRVVKGAREIVNGFEKVVNDWFIRYGK